MKIIEDYVVPVLRFDTVEGRPSIRGFHGTAFFINRDGLFLTAAHVLQRAADDVVANGGYIAFPIRIPGDPSKRIVARVVDWAAAPIPNDVAIGRCDKATASCFFMGGETKVWMWQDVRTVGFPDSTRNVSDEGVWHLAPRGFKGHVTRRIRATDHFTRPHPDLFELSFAVPTGLSGGPVVVPVGDLFDLVGVCVANSDSEVLEYKFTEIQEGDKHYSEEVRRVESFGLADDLRALRKWAPTVLGGRTLWEAVAPDR
jgi:hypothetical protein